MNYDIKDLSGWSWLLVQYYFGLHEEMEVQYFCSSVSDPPMSYRNPDALETESFETTADMPTVCFFWPLCRSFPRH